MSIIIKGMEMPKSCDICPFSKTNDDLMSDDYRFRYCDFPYIGEFVTDYEGSRHPACPLIPEVDGDGYEDGSADDIPVVFKKDIEAIPAADVRPVVRGRWEHMVQAIVDTTANCSVCKREAVWRTRNKPYAICPNCGADMREVQDDR